MRRSQILSHVVSVARSDGSAGPAAAAAAWADEGVLSGLLLLVVVRAASFLALAIHAGEMVRLFRAGLFLNHLSAISTAR